MFFLAVALPGLTWCTDKLRKNYEGPPSFVEVTGRTGYIPCFHYLSLSRLIPSHCHIVCVFLLLSIFRYSLVCNHMHSYLEIGQGALPSFLISVEELNVVDV